MSSALAPLVKATSPTSESSSTSTNTTPNSNHPHEKPNYPPPLMPNQLNDNFDVDRMNSPSFSMLDNKENKDDTNTINNNKNYSHVKNSNNSSTTTIVGSNNVGALKGPLSNGMGFPSTGADESKRSCNRCQNCQGFSSHEWRNTCTTCRCPRSSHDISIGARCCGFHRAGLDPAVTGVAQHQNTQIQKNNSLSTISNSSSTSSSTSKSQNTSSMQPPPPSGTAPAIDANSTISNANNPASTIPSGVSCSRTSVAEAAGYSWMPQGLSESKVEEWMQQLPQNKVPKIGSEGETYRQLQLAHQLPKQDLSLKYCSHIAPKDKSSYQDFICARNDIALDIGHIITYHQPPPPAMKSACRKCKKALADESLVVVAPRFGVKTYWHPGCFTCTTCDELLVDMTYCVHDESLYCGRHYAENLKPRCGACDELIFAGQYTKALGKDFHPEHFVCVSCNESLTGNQYVLTDDHPCCIPCYEQNFTHNCSSCQNRIGLDSKDMSYKDMHWHEACFVCKKCQTSMMKKPFAVKYLFCKKYECTACFACKKCNTSLVDKPFAAKNTLIFCAACYDAEFASRCDACGDTFRPGMKKMEYKTKKWHDKCFQCVVCKQQVGSKPFIIPNDTDVYCVGCFEEKFATKCTKCKKIMTTGGVTFKNEAWHRECFVCTQCKTMLAGQKFASRQDQPYCATCFGELFAKRCTACTKPITGAGGTRFISFEGRHWHSQCFVCALCKVSMAGKGFITDGEDIICPECAKDKLMGASNPQI